MDIEHMKKRQFRRYLRSRKSGPKRALWTGRTRRLGTTVYHLFDDGSMRHHPPKVRGKSARRAEKKARHARS